MMYRLYFLSLVLLVTASISGQTKAKIYQFTDGERTINAEIEKLWPLGNDDAKEKELSRNNLISFVGVRNDTIFVLSETPKLFYNDMYEFMLSDEIIEAFSKASIEFLEIPCGCGDGDEYEGEAPDQVRISTHHGVIYDNLFYVNWPRSYSILGGCIQTNQLFTISKKCKIDTPATELFDFLGLLKLGIEVPTEWLNTNGVLVVDRTIKEFNSVTNNYSIGSLNGVSRIFIHISRGRISRIDLGFSNLASDEEYIHYNLIRDYRIFPF